MTEIKVTSKPEMGEIANRMARATKNIFGRGSGDLDKMGAQLLRYVKTEAPKNTGQSAEKIRSESFVSGLTVGFRIVLPEVYSNFVIPGTRAHPIFPRNAKVLRFVVNGKVVFARSVSHPGTKPNPFPERALNKWKPEAQAGLQRIGNRWVFEVAGK